MPTTSPSRSTTGSREWGLISMSPTMVLGDMSLRRIVTWSQGVNTSRTGVSVNSRALWTSSAVSSSTPFSSSGMMESMMSWSSSSVTVGSSSSGTRATFLR